MVLGDVENVNNFGTVVYRKMISCVTEKNMLDHVRRKLEKNNLIVGGSMMI